MAHCKSRRSGGLLQERDPGMQDFDTPATTVASEPRVSLPPPCARQRIGDVAARIAADILSARWTLRSRREPGRGGRHAV